MFAYFHKKDASVVPINEIEYKAGEHFDIMGLESCRRILYLPVEPGDSSDMFTEQYYQEGITTLDAPLA